MPAPAPRSYPASSPRASTPARCSSPRASTPASSGAGRPMAELTVELVRPAQAPGQPVIELTGAGKTYRTGALEFEALREIDLRIDEGEYVAVMGPSGSGKSTLMNLIGCLDTLTVGGYRIAGDDVAEMDEVDLAEIRNRRIGFVFQQFNLLASLPAWRNVELPLLYGRVPLHERKARADEPTGNLDSVATREVLALLDELNGHGRTIVLITHELEVAQHARRIVWLRDGRIHTDEVNHR